MRAFVRLPPRLLFLGVAAAALLVLAERERPAHADALPPITPPSPPALPALPALPAPPFPIPPSLPSVPAPALPGPPPPAPPDLAGAPAPAEVPDAPVVDPDGLTGVVGPLPAVPEVAPPEPMLPDLPAVPEVTDVPVPSDRVLELSATPAPDVSAPADAPDRVPLHLLGDPPGSRLDAGGAFGLLFGGDVTLAPARGPPGSAPGSPHPCPGGGSPHLTRTDPAAFLDPAVDDASRRAGLPAEARAYASTLLRDPLLRPD